MTTEQKSQIFALRVQGFGYATIAKAMELNKDTVKSFCRRNGATGIRAAKRTEQPNRCPQCGKKLIQVEKQKPRGSALTSADRRGGTLTQRWSNKRRSTAMSAPPVGNRSPPTATATASTAPTSAMCRPGFKEVQRHDEGAAQPGNSLSRQSRTLPPTVGRGTHLPVRLR